MPIEPQEMSDAEIVARVAEATSRGAEVLCELGVLLRALGKLEASASCYHQAMTRAPHMPAARTGLAAALTDLAGLTEPRAEKIQLYEQALSLHPTNVEALYNLGVAWMEERRLERAAFLFEIASHFDPGHAEALNNLGVLHKDMTSAERAAEYYLAALRARPSFPEALNNLAVVYTSQGRARDAALLFEEALRLDAGYAQAHNNLGVQQMDLGAVPDALASFERCLDCLSDDRCAGHNRLLALNYLRSGDDPLVSDAHRAWAKSFSERCPPLPSLTPDEAVRRASDAQRPIVVGYLSPDLFTHSVSYFIEAPLRFHDPARARVIVYSCVLRPDETTWRLRRMVESGGHVFRDVGHLREDDLAHQVRADEVDILVELAGHMANNRLGCVARCPAPVQVTWMGYPTSTGLAAVDFRFTDARCDPPAPSKGPPEELVRLPGTFLCYTPPPGPPDVSRLPALDRGFVTFGSFNSLAKVTPEVLHVWSRILRAIPDARLLLKRRPFACEATRRRMMSNLASQGFDPERVILAPPRLDVRDHLTAYAEVDVSLDPWPYTGVTTTCESLLMGAPVITLRGQGHAHNVAYSLLSAAGLAEAWSATEPEEYVGIAARAATDLKSLARLRAGLRDRLLASPLCDGPRFVAGLEDVYRGLWDQWRARVLTRAR